MMKRVTPVFYISRRDYFWKGTDGRGKISHISYYNLIQKHDTFCIKLIFFVIRV